MKTNNWNDNNRILVSCARIYSNSVPGFIIRYLWYIDFRICWYRAKDRDKWNGEILQLLKFETLCWTNVNDEICVGRFVSLSFRLISEWWEHVNGLNVNKKEIKNKTRFCRDNGIWRKCNFRFLTHWVQQKFCWFGNLFEQTNLYISLP